MKSERGPVVQARQRAVHERIQIAFDKSEPRAAGEADERQIGDAQPARFAREEGEHDDGQRLRQFLDRRTEKPCERSRGIGARIGEQGICWSSNASSGAPMAP